MTTQSFTRLTAPPQAPVICEAVDSVSDADFGYWNSAWGDPPVHEFPCTNLAVMSVIDPYDGEPILLCATHGRA